MSERVLLVDDQQSVREVVAIMLAQRGGEVVAVASGEEAIERLKNEDFDLVVTDNSMPGGMSGRDMIMRMRMMKQYEMTPVILVSGDSGLTCEECNVDAIVRKPFKFGVLVKVADMVCSE